MLLIRLIIYLFSLWKLAEVTSLAIVNFILFWKSVCQYLMLENNCIQFTDDCLAAHQKYFLSVVFSPQ